MRPKSQEENRRSRKGNHFLRVTQHKSQIGSHIVSDNGLSTPTTQVSLGVGLGSCGAQWPLSLSYL